MKRLSEPIWSILKSLKKLRFASVFLSIFLTSTYMCTSTAMASDGMFHIAEINSPVYTSLDILLDAISIFLLLIAIVYIVMSIRNYGKSTIGIVILYFLNATIVLGAIRLIFILGDDNIIPIHDITETTGWHLLLCYSVIVFYFAGKMLTSLVDIKSKKVSYNRAYYFMLFTLIFCTLVIGSLTFFDNIIAQYLQNSWINTFGAFHILGVIVTAFIAIYLYWVKTRYKVFNLLIGYMHIAIGLITTICLWELLNESWKVIVVSDNFGEFIERVLWVPVFIFILISFSRLLKLSTKTSPAEIRNGSVVSSAKNNLAADHPLKKHFVYIVTKYKTKNIAVG